MAQPQKKKKKRVLEFEQHYVDRLPLSDMYEKSYMHRDNVTHVVVTPRSQFVVTASSDGHLKFWKIIPGGLDFVKHYKAHLSPIMSVAASADGSRLCTTYVCVGVWVLCGGWLCVLKRAVKGVMGRRWRFGGRGGERLESGGGSLYE